MGNTTNRFPFQKSFNVSVPTEAERPAASWGDAACTATERCPDASTPPKTRRGRPFSTTRCDATETGFTVLGATDKVRARAQVPFPGVVAESANVLTTAPTMGAPERSTTVPLNVVANAQAGSARKVRMILTRGAFRERTDVRVSPQNMIDEQLRQRRIDAQRSAKMSGQPVTTITLMREFQSKLK